MVRVRGEQKGIEYYMNLPYSVLLHQVEEEDEKYWIAEIPELPGCRSHGSTVGEAISGVEEAKKDWILDSLETGEEIPIPTERDKYSGKTLLRMSHSLHRALALMADNEGVSLNQLVVTILAKEVGRIDTIDRVEGKIDRLAGKIDDVIEKESLRRSVSPLRIVARRHKLDEYVILDEAYDVASFTEVGIGEFTPDLANTASPFENMRRFQQPSSPIWKEILPRTKDAEQRDYSRIAIVKDE
jgi:predicted HicB family RNase H-like nuclease